MPLSFTIGNKRIFYHTCSESSKPLLSDQIVLLIERPTFWLKSRKTMNMHRTKHWQTVREQLKSDSDMREGGIKNSQKNPDVFYGRPLR